MRSALPLFRHVRSSRAATIGGSVALMVVMAGCAGEPADDTASQPPPSSEDAGDFPVEITSCGVTTTIDAPVENAVTLNQGATEVVLALGAGDQLAGTAYLDDAVPEKWTAAYDAVPVLSDEYPTQEEFLAVDPDFAYGSYASAFDKKTIGTADELAAQDIAPYLSPFGCEDTTQRPPAAFESVWEEVDAVASAFGVSDAADALRAEQEEQLATLAETKPGEGLTVLWYDSGDKTPFVGAGAGGPQLVLDAIGATNLFADVEGSWADASWEKVVEADPDVIVFADAAWSSAEEKQAYLEGDPVLSELTAVQEQAYVVVPFSESTVGVRLVDGAQSVADQLASLG